MASLLFVAGAAGAGELEPVSETHFEDSVRPALETYCGDCHHPDDDANHVRFLGAATADDVAHDRGLWANVAEQLHNRTMPPADSDQPPEADRLAVAEWIESHLRSTACDRGPYAGPVTARRLNRTEYDNTLRDLLGLDLGAAGLEPSATFPADGAGGEGFDNNGETLFLPPILMERYLLAAGEALDAAVWSPRVKAWFLPGDLLPATPDAGETAVAGDTRELPPGGELSAVLPVFLEGDVTVNVLADGPPGAAVGLRVDGVAAGALTLDGAGGVPPRARTVVRLTRGRHLLTLTNPGDAALAVRVLEAWDDRPDAPPPHAAASHRFLLGVSPGVTPADPRGAARDALARFVRRAYRRPPRAGEADRLMSLYDRAADRGDPWEEAFKLAARGALVSPHFLFRTEAGDESNGADAPPGGSALTGEPEFVGDYALASRLSYFLWASMPDEELFELAGAGRLTDPGVLDGQVDRMLADGKAASFADRFAGQWLGTHEVGGRVAPDVNRFRALFGPPLLDDLRDQSGAWFLYMLREDRPLRELIDADYVVATDRLAYHYGLAEPPEKLRGPWRKDRDWGPKWQHEHGKPGLDPAFKRFELTGDGRDRRGGVLGLGGALLASSYPERTSPVLRGAWVLETLLGVRVPPPPPDVPDLKIGKKSDRSVREELADHRADPACAACHNLMDPVGFALDNYDVVGRWRETYGGNGGDRPIDASAALPTGEAFAGPGGLRQILLAREDRVVRHLTSKLLGYALGRSLEDGDDCTVDRIAAEVAANGGSTRTLVKAVARSVPFRMVARGDGE